MKPLVVALLLVGCGRPTDALRRIAAERAPLLPEREADEIPFATLHPGDLVEVGARERPLDWKGTLDGHTETRGGPMVRVRRAAGEPWVFAFASDLGDEVRAPTTEWACRRMGGPKECAARARRVAPRAWGGATLAYDPCSLGACRLALLSGDHLSALTLEGLADVVPALVEGQAVALAHARWVKDPTWTGATTTVLRLAGDARTPRLERALSIDTESVDARHPPAMQRMGALAAEGGVLTFRGSRRAIAPTTGNVLHTETIHEQYHLAPAR